MRLNAVSHHSSTAGSGAYSSSGSYSGDMVLPSALHGDRQRRPGDPDHGDPAHHAGVAAEHVERIVLEFAVAEAHQPAAVAPASVLGAGREGVALVAVVAVGQHAEAEMAGA